MELPSTAVVGEQFRPESYYRFARSVELSHRLTSSQEASPPDEGLQPSSPYDTTQPPSRGEALPPLADDRNDLRRHYHSTGEYSSGTDIQHSLLSETGYPAT